MVFPFPCFFPIPLSIKGFNPLRNIPPSYPADCSSRACSQLLILFTPCPLGVCGDRQGRFPRSPFALQIPATQRPHHDLIPAFFLKVYLCCKECLFLLIPSSVLRRLAPKNAHPGQLPLVLNRSNFEPLIILEFISTQLLTAPFYYPNRNDPRFPFFLCPAEEQSPPPALLVPTPDPQLGSVQLGPL